ncbi:MAG: hypothetical protein Q8M31_16705 [Beijerinckiaceae bacterium]|nr:hypothetical protein [Beijerinckiaceae bacterium]
MGAELGRKAGVFFLGAAALSLLFPGRKAATEPAAPAPSQKRPHAARQPRRMWALVQVRPDVQVLAVSASRAELERELAELNLTWNHCELREERQRYIIQASPVLFPTPPEPGPCIAPAGRERTDG